MITSPFKLLDAYTAADQNAFWGRDEEIADLYGMVTKNRLILVYGQSGTGKTSLVQCGLAGRFDRTDWYPVFVRREQDLNQSLEQALGRILREPLNLTREEPERLALALENIYETYLRPVYLVFDQMEELFILGSPREQEQFATAIQGVLNSTTPCRILFIIREEYLAYLYNFEKRIPSLFDRRLRVEPMSATKVNQVLDGSFKTYNIQVPAPAGQLYQQIIDNVSGGKAGIQLPYLQVYLDLLYREDFARTYPGRSTDGREWLPLTFSTDEIGSLGKIDNVLEKFLLEQMHGIQQGLQQKFQGIPPEAVRQVLDAFVSEEGTKRPVAYEWRGEDLQIEPHWAALFKPLSNEALGYCCRRLEQARLLRFSDRYVELAHDALAALIDQKRSAQERRLQETYARLLHNFREFADTGEYLSRKQLNAVEEYLPQMESRLNAEIKAFIRQSAEKLEETEKAELLTERRKRRQALTIAVAGCLLAAVAIIAAVMAYNARKNIARKAFEIQLNAASALKTEGKYAEAMRQLNSLEGFATDLPASDKQEIAQLKASWTQVAQLVGKGDSIRTAAEAKDKIEANRRLPEALSLYRQAYTLSPDTHIETRIGQAQKDIDRRFDDYLLDTRTMITNNKDSLAFLYANMALIMHPDDPIAKNLLKGIRWK